MRIITIAATLLAVTGCAVNPVTGERQLNLYGEKWERQVGEQQYAPLRQAQGGDFILDPTVADYVNEVGQRLAAQADRELDYEFTVINSSVPNAWALPGGKMAINRGLLTELESEAQLAAVLGHEVVHAAASHGAQAYSRSTVTQGAVILGAIAVGAATDRDEYAQVALLGGLLGAHLINLQYSRSNEREADEYGMRYMHAAGYDPMGAVRLQETFVRLSENREPGFMGGLFASHPPSQERVENNRQTARELGSGGKTGEERHRRALARLNELQPAYEAHDEGRKALAEDQVEVALRKADEALALEDGEALFHALRGDALATAERYGEAESAFDQALSRDPDWFYHHLRRGMLREIRGNRTGARQDLHASIERIETAQAHLYLGHVERADGNRQQAIEHYRTAAQSDSEAGQKARQALVEMGVAEQSD